MVLGEAHALHQADPAPHDRLAICFAVAFWFVEYEIDDALRGFPDDVFGQYSASSPGDAEYRQCILSLRVLARLDIARHRIRTLRQPRLGNHAVAVAVVLGEPSS